MKLSYCYDIQLRAIDKFCRDAIMGIREVERKEMKGYWIPNGILAIIFTGGAFYLLAIGNAFLAGFWGAIGMLNLLLSIRFMYP